MERYLAAEAGTQGEDGGKFLLLAEKLKRQLCTLDACHQRPSPAAQVTEEMGSWQANCCWVCGGGKVPRLAAQKTCETHVCCMEQKQTTGSRSPNSQNFHPRYIGFNWNYIGFNHCRDKCLGKKSRDLKFWL
jgi:hypothetical protein